jgi:hypothetical protein
MFLSRFSAGRLAALLAVPALAVAVSACGGHGTKSTPAKAARSFDLHALAARAFGPNAKARSGRIDGDIALRLHGAHGFGAPFSLTTNGPFRYRKGAALPDYRIDMGVRDNGVQLTSAGGRSYVSVGSTGYEVPGGVRARLVRSSSRGANGLTRTLAQFGITIRRWETHKHVAGTQRMDGVEVVHVKTGVNVGRVLRDANTLTGLLSSLGIARATGLPREISPGARRVLVRSVTAASGSSWIGVSDGVLREAALTIRFTIAPADRAAVGGMSGGTVTATMKITDVGRPQRIVAPHPLGSYADFQLGLSALGDARSGG